jgi:hypothetical protein
VNPKVKVAGTYKADKWCNCPNQISATRAPEAARDRRFPRLRQEHAEVTSPITNKLLFEAWVCTSSSAGATCTFASRRLARRPGARSAAAAADLGDRAEQQPDLPWREINNNTLVPNFSYSRRDVLRHRHARVQGGLQPHARFLEEYQYAMNPVSYRFNGGVANQITLMNRPYTANSNMDNDFGCSRRIAGRWTGSR